MSRKKLGGLLAILLAMGFISQRTYCRLCDPNDKACAAVCSVTPTPTPSPTIEPTPEPTVEPTVSPTPIPTSTPIDCRVTLCPPDKHCVPGEGCVPNSPPTSDIKTNCGLPMPNGVSVFVKAKSYGQGVDTELNVLDWPALCTFIHGNPANPNQCHLEGLDAKGYSRVACEMAIIKVLSNGAGNCPVGIWQTASHPGDNHCVQTDPYDSGGMSCDHFGNTTVRDDPNTSPFEGEPAICGEQRDSDDHPTAGFFWIGHGDGEMKACLPNYEGCSRGWLRVVH